MATPLFIDDLTLPTNLGTDAHIHISAELMQNTLKAFPIDFDSRDTCVEMVHDDTENPIIFAIGLGNTFNVIPHHPGKKDNWPIIDLTQHIVSGKKVVSYDVTQSIDHKISLAVIISENGNFGDADSTLYVAHNVSNAHDADWTQLTWQKVSFEQSSFVPHTVAISSDSSTPVMIVIGKSSEEFKYAVVLDGQSGKINEFGQDIIQGEFTSSVGYYNGQDTFLNYYNSGELEIITADKLHHHTFNASDFSRISGGNFTSFASVLPSKSGSNFSSDLYVSNNKGIWVFNNLQHDSDYLFKVADLPNIKELSVRVNDNIISVWAKDDNDLYYISGKYDSQNYDYKFNPPILFKKDIYHLAPVRSAQKKRNELLLIDKDRGLHHCWQDANTTAWHEQIIKEKNKKTLVNINTFTTHISFKDKNCRTLMKVDTTNRKATPVSVKVYASEWIYTTINGKVYGIDRDTPAIVPLDNMGNITLLLPVSKIASPLFYIEADFLSKAINILPHGKSLKQYGTVNSVQDLRQGGLDVQDNAKSRGVAKSVKKLHKHTSEVSNHLENDCAYVKLTATGKANWYDGGVGSSSLIRSNAHLPKYQDLLGSDIGDVWDSVGDFFKKTAEYLEKEVEAIEDDVIKIAGDIELGLKAAGDALVFFIKDAAGAVYHVVLDTVDHVFSAIESIFKAIAQAIDDLIKFVGFLFSWEDILNTHEVLDKIFTQGIDFLIPYVEGNKSAWRAQIDTFLDGIEAHLDNMELPAHIKHQDINQQTANTAKTNPHYKHSHHPASNFSYYHAHHSHMSSGTPAHAVHQMAAILKVQQRQDINDFFINDLYPIVQHLLSDIEDVFKRFFDLIVNPTPEALHDFVKSLVHTGVDLLKEFMHGILDFTEMLLNALKQGLTTEADPLFIGDFYSAVTGGKSFTMSRGSALLVAIPFTVIYKLFFDVAPFSDGDGSKILKQDNFIQKLLQQSCSELSLAEGENINWASSIFNITTPIYHTVAQIFIIADIEEEIARIELEPNEAISVNSSFQDVFPLKVAFLGIGTLFEFMGVIAEYMEKPEKPLVLDMITVACDIAVICMEEEIKSEQFKKGLNAFIYVLNISDLFADIWLICDRPRHVNASKLLMEILKTINTCGRIAENVAITFARNNKKSAAEETIMYGGAFALGTNIVNTLIASAVLYEEIHGE